MPRTDRTSPNRTRYVQRRGTFLILVVGTLAMLALITVLYASIGRADRQTGNAVQREETLKLYPDQSADWVASVIAEDLFDQIEIDPTTTSVQELRPERWDYPSHDPEARAPRDPDADLDGDMRTDYFHRLTPGSDPWLASTEPEWLNLASNPVSALEELPLLARDWRHISNFAPDGLPVNLSALRNNFGATRQDLTRDLYLLDVAGNPTRRIADGTLGGSPADFSGPGGTPSVPAEWFSNQIGLFRFAGPRLNAPYRPADPEYLPNQYADADGDRMYDSRWIELRFGTDPEPEIDLAPDATDFRYFLAIRAMDLSALVNVNTATDARFPPDRDIPVGMTPAEVDLRRLLTLQDFYVDYLDLAVNGLAGIQQPVSGDNLDVENYENYTTEDPRNSPYSAASERYGDDLRPALSTDFFEENEDDLGYRVLLKPDERALYYENVAGNAAGPSTRFGISDYAVSRARFGIADLVELLTYWTVNNPDVTSTLETTVSGLSRVGRDKPASRGVLREARSFALERDQRNNDEFLDGEPADDDAYYHRAADARHRLTTVSGARPDPAAVNIVDLLDDLSVLPGNDIDQVRIDDLFEMILASLTGTEEGEAIPDTHWNPTDGDYARNRTRYYGHRGPEVAVRTAAHLTANLIDSYDFADTDGDGTDDTGSTPFTLLLDESARGTVAGATWSFWDENSLDPEDVRIPTGGSAGRPQAINVFGIEPQPFITAVAHYALFTDAPVDAGGDVEWTMGGVPAFPGDPASIVPGSMTIDTSIDSTNNDYLFSALAVQIHNPFDHEIDLGGLGDQIGEGDYYLEYAGRTYRLAGISTDPSSTGWTDTAPTDSITLEPRETRVFYAIGENPTAISARIEQVAGAYFGAGVTSAIQPSQYPTAAGEHWTHAWARAQLEVTGAGGNTSEPVFMFECTDEVTGANLDPSAPDLVNGTLSISASPEDKYTLRLWQVRFGNSDSEGSNSQENDQLIDRFRLPSSAASLSARNLQTGGGDEVNNASGGPDPTEPEFGIIAVGDNEGLSAMTWVGFRRHADPSLAIPNGAFPAYCIESSDRTIGLSNSIQQDDGMTGPSSDPEVGQYSGGTGVSSERDFNLFIGRMVELNGTTIGGSTPEQFFDDIGQDPSQWSTTVPLPPFSAAGQDYDAVYPEFNLDNNEFRRVGLILSGSGGTTTGDVSTFRPADIFLPWGIGPWYNPAGVTEDEQWTTLSEAVAYAMGFDDSMEGATSEADDPFFGGGNALYDSARPTLLDRMQLRTDAFVAFVDDDTNGTYDTTTGTNDVRLDPAVPMAATILDRFTALVERRATSNFPVLAEPDQLVPGLVNINTAPLAVLRTLPMLTPSRESNSFTSDSDWWLYDTAATTSQLDESTDIAAAIAAYRDKGTAYPLRNTTAAQIIDFSNLNDGADTAGADDDDGRFYFNQINGIRETPGFRSLGELLAVRYATDTSIHTQVQPYHELHSIDRLARPMDLDQPPEGVESIYYGTASPPTLEDGIPNDYGESLAIANAVLNSVSIRSDVYAVWMLIHGYAEQDVTGLRPDDPLVPTVQRRFLMILDRSNVQSPTDRPRILYQQEIPL